MATVQDIIPWLRDAIERLRLAGRPADADLLESAIACAYTTSSEMLGGIGIAILRVEQRLGADLPDGVAEVFQRCLVEIRKVWPQLR